MNKDKHPERTTVTISVDTVTKRRLKKVAKCNHMTVSAMITAWAWQQPISKNQKKEAYADE